MRNTFPVLAKSIGHLTAVCPFAANLRQNYMQQLKPVFLGQLLDLLHCFLFIKLYGSAAK